MNGWEFANHLIDMMYEHYIATFFFLLALAPWNTVQIGYKDRKRKREEECESVNGKS